MKRRYFLVAGATAVVAGCAGAGSDDGDEPDVSSGENDGESDRGEDDGGTDPGPSDGEIEAAIEDAEAGLAAAMDEIDAQTGGFAGLDATIPLDNEPILAELEPARAAISEITDADLPDERERVVTGLNRATRFVSAVVEIQPALYDLYHDVADLMEDVEARNWAAANDARGEISDAINDLETGEVTMAYMGASEAGAMEPVEALDGDAVEAQHQRVSAERSAITSIVSGVRILRNGDDALESGVSILSRRSPSDDDLETAIEAFEEAVEAYGEAADRAGGAGLAGAIQWFACHGGALESAARTYEEAAQLREDGDDDWEDVAEDAEEYVEDAEECELSV
ncbi:hypothetical protein [Halovivax gelatinilyticus]|uniref:hypothetical protein n=1 Tax=Halovivax gelatinilyticus TaxID=2961597 RepID=UPI0020CA4DB2|nr:hypothetical protein [Halovivax gelatinilyticus]